MPVLFYFTVKYVWFFILVLPRHMSADCMGGTVHLHSSTLGLYLRWVLGFHRLNFKEPAEKVTPTIELYGKSE